MRKAVLVLTLMLMVAACSSMALADGYSETYTITGTYAPNVPALGGVVAPGTFSLEVGVPSFTLDGSGYYPLSVLAYSLNGSPVDGVPVGTPMSAIISGGELDITFNQNGGILGLGTSYYWDFVSIADNLISANDVFGLPDGLSTLLVLDTTTGVSFGDITGGQITAATPEPASLLLMGSGLIGLGGMVRRKLFL